MSMENLRQVRAVADKYGKPVVFDSARFARMLTSSRHARRICRQDHKGDYTRDVRSGRRHDNERQEGRTRKHGGFIATRKQEWYEGAKGYCVQFEGYLTYGGMNGRDMNALAIGLDENTEFDNLDTRIRQVQLLARLLDDTAFLISARQAATPSSLTLQRCSHMFRRRSSPHRHLL